MRGRLVGGCQGEREGGSQEGLRVSELAALQLGSHFLSHTQSTLD